MTMTVMGEGSRAFSSLSLSLFVGPSGGEGGGDVDRGPQEHAVVLTPRTNVPELFFLHNKVKVLIIHGIMYSLE